MQIPIQMSTKNSSLLPASMPIALYTSQQVYAIEQQWFRQGYDSFGLMQQAAWQMSQRIIQLQAQNNQDSITDSRIYGHNDKQLRASIWVGAGNNGGDGWLIAHYLQQAGWQVQVISVGINKLTGSKTVNNNDEKLPDAIKAQRMALAADCPYVRFEDGIDIQTQHNQQHQAILNNHSLVAADIYVDALFGIGLDRAPIGIYQQAIIAFNNATQQAKGLVIAVDIPSGLVASTGQVFEQTAIQAHMTLCLIARKFGLHTKDAMDYAGEIIDIPLIPYDSVMPVATLLTTGYRLSIRKQNSYKGSYGHVLIIGGNRIDGSQGMGGAAILAASSAMVTGAGKITVACHEAFHGALLTSLPDAMTINLHDVNGVKALLKDASIIAIGMGLGRDAAAKALFISYVAAAITYGKAIVIDADGLYHLASLDAEQHKLVTELREYSKQNQVYLTPHSGETAHLLAKKITDVEADRLAAIKQGAELYGGNWLLKGAGSLVLEQSSEQQQIYVCGVGNPGMATAGMGDVLSGLLAGLLAQQDLHKEARSLRQAVLIHGLAGDILVRANLHNSKVNSALMIGQRGLQAQDMPNAIRHVIQLLTGFD
jgi:hydroxyethylthiazole kinase-like uncharacterized protein yjeF